MIFTGILVFSLGSPLRAQETATEGSAAAVPPVPLPMTLPSNIFDGDVTPSFVDQLVVVDQIPASLGQMGLPGYFSEYVFVVDKTVRSLSIWKFSDSQWQRVAYHPTDIGKKMGDKHILGDHRTPEGVYFFTDRYEGQNLDFSLYGSRAFATDYPNLFDRREGKTGSGIWLHAVPDSVPLTRGSRGCVVVRDEIIKKVTDYISVKKTPIIIKEKEEYLTAQEWKSRQEAFTNWLNEWRLAWENKDLEQYMSFYSQEDFFSLRKNWRAWRTYKKALNDKYDFMSLRFSEPRILIHKDEAVIQFLQDYRSNLFSDFGEKTLHLKNEGGAWKIVSEQWTAVPAKWHPAPPPTTQVGSVSQ